MIDAMKKIASVGEGFVVALSVEKQLVFFERGSFQKQMNHQHICYWWAHEVLHNLCSSPMAAVIDVKWRRKDLSSPLGLIYWETMHTALDSKHREKIWNKRRLHLVPHFEECSTVS
jgi:hypothetical protein